MVAAAIFLLLLVTLAGPIIGTRQILLHILHGDTDYGAPVLGLSPYT